MVHWCSGLAYRPVTAATRVRVPYGPLRFLKVVVNTGQVTMMIESLGA